MKARYRASFDLQAPEPQTTKRVCPACRQELAAFLVTCDGHAFETYRCRDHGDVILVQNHVVTGEYKP